MKEYDYQFFNYLEAIQNGSVSETLNLKAKDGWVVHTFSYDDYGIYRILWERDIDNDSNS